MTVDNLTVITINVKEIASSQKRLKLMYYFKRQLDSNSSSFCKRLIHLQKTRRNDKTILRVNSFTI